MKFGFIVLGMCLALQATALPLSRQARQEAKLLNTFLEASYAQRRGDSARFELLQRTLAQDPQNAYLKQQLVAEALAASAPRLAEPYADFIEGMQDDAEAWMVYAMYQWNKKDVAAAVQAYEKALELEPENEQIWYQYVVLLAGTEPDKAIEKLEELAQERPSLAPEAYMEAGRLKAYQHQYDKALAYFDKSLALDSSSVQPLVGRAHVYEKTNQYFLMLHELEELEKRGYTTPQTLVQMGSVFVLVKDFPRAQHYFLKAKALENNNISANYFLAVLAEQEGDYKSAANYLTDSADYASSATKQIQVSYYLRKANQTEESFAIIRRAYQQFPDSAEAAYLYATALFEQKKYAAAAKILAQLVEKYPTNQEIRLQYAFTLEGQGKYRLMEENIHLLLEQEPHNAAALNLLAYSLALRNTRLEEAAGYSARALSVWPQDASLLDTQAWIFYLQGKYAQAADLLKAIPEESLQAYGEMAYHAGMIYQAQGDIARARRYLQLAIDSGWKPAKKALKKLN